ncbi:MAG: hypothetical protein NTW19_24500 [Planctomycetota bacterium]|nr:hypothetical protein [Planctomycetota bacterium]
MLDTTIVVRPDNALFIRVGDVTVCDGLVRLLDAWPYWPAQGSPARPSVEKPSDGVTSRLVWSVSGDTAIGTLTVRNAHPSFALPWLSLEIPQLRLPGPVDCGSVEAIQMSWALNTWSIGHPGTRQRLGAWAMVGQAPGQSIGWSFCPLGEEETPKNLIRRPPGTPDLFPLFFMRKPVAPGGSATLRFAIRCSAMAGGIDKRYLLEPYRDSHWRRFPTYGYATTREPIVAAFAMSQPGLVNPGNPFGYKGGHDLTGEAPTAWALDQVKICRDLGCAELVLWDPGGCAPPTMLNAEFAPARIARAASALIAAAGPMRVGLGARVGIVTDPSAPASLGMPAGVRARRIDEIDALVADFNRALDMGFDFIYGDEVGTRPNDVVFTAALRASQWAKRRIGAGFAERLVDVLAPHIGGYTNAYVDGTPGAGGFRFGPAITAGDVALFQWLRPGLPFVVQIRDASEAGGQMEAAYRFCLLHGARPIIPWWAAKTWVPIFKKIAAEVAATGGAESPIQS